MPVAPTRIVPPAPAAGNSGLDWQTFALDTATVLDPAGILDAAGSDLPNGKLAKKAVVGQFSGATLTGLGLLQAVGDPMDWSAYHGLVAELTWDDTAWPTAAGRFGLAVVASDGAGAWVANHACAGGPWNTSTTEQVGAVYAGAASASRNPLAGGNRSAGRGRVLFAFGAAGVIGCQVALFDPTWATGQGEMDTDRLTAAWTALHVGIAVEDNQATARTWQGITMSWALLPRTT